MAKILRKTLLAFGSQGPVTSFGQFGSKVAGLPQTSQDPDVIQGLAAWINGWQNAVVTTNKAGYIEDMNGWCLVHSYMTAYLLQQGIPEWDIGTTYYLNSVVQANNGQWFNSLQDNNIGNAPPVGASNALWKWVNAPAIPPQAIPTGTIIDHAGGATPSGYLPCDGAAVNRITYATLFAQIGVIWGSGDSINTFNVPNFNRRVAVGSGGSSTTTLANTVGSIGGEEVHTLIISEIPSHTHQVRTAGSTSVGAGGSASPTILEASGATGGGAAHNNIQPSAVVIKLIKT